MTKITPKTANTEKKLCEMKRNNWSWKNHWFMVDECKIIIAEQANGEKAKGVVNIPKKVFEAIIRVYETGNKKTVAPHR